MVISSAAVSLLVLSLFAMAWMAVRERVTRRDGTKPYHIGLYQQDRRKGRFYYQSVWMGLAAAFVALACLQVVANTLMAASNARNVILGAAYGLGLWGLLIVGLVWTQIGHRSIEFNSDGKALTPLPQEMEQKKEKK
jgi:hypothetical protein